MATVTGQVYFSMFNGMDKHEGNVMPLSNVPVFLHGVDSNGNGIAKATLTKETGIYAFDVSNGKEEPYVMTLHFLNTFNSYEAIDTQEKTGNETTNTQEKTSDETPCILLTDAFVEIKIIGDTAEIPAPTLYWTPHEGDKLYEPLRGSLSGAATKIAGAIEEQLVTAIEELKPKDIQPLITAVENLKQPDPNDALNTAKDDINNLIARWIDDGKGKEGDIFVLINSLPELKKESDLEKPKDRAILKEFRKIFEEIKRNVPERVVKGLELQESILSPENVERIKADTASANNQNVKVIAARLAGLVASAKAYKGEKLSKLSKTEFTNQLQNLKDQFDRL